MADKIEQETSTWKKGVVEGEGEEERHIISAGQKEARAAPSTVPTVPFSSSDPSGRSHAQAVLDQLSDSSFDFGVVAVYSCPNSCSSFSTTDTGNHHYHRDSHSHSHSYSNDEKNSSSNSKSKSSSSSANISSTNPPSHHSTASTSAGAGRVCYEYIVVQPPADF